MKPVGEMQPTKIVVLEDESVGSQKKILLLRNTTSQEIAIKLNCSSSYVSVSHQTAIIPSKKIAKITVTFTGQSTNTRQTDLLQLAIYAREVHQESIAQLKKWLIEPVACEKQSSLAFLLRIVVSKKFFSAPVVVLDLPGRACMIETEARLDRGENDTMTAKHITNKDLLYEVNRPRGKDTTTVYERIRTFLDTVYPPSAAI